MSSLYDPPIDLTNPIVYELRDLLLNAYPDRRGARRAAQTAGLLPGRFPDGDDLRLDWLIAMERLTLQGKLRNLVELARDDPQNEGQEARFEQMLQERPTIRTPEPKLEAGRWKGDDEQSRVATRLYQERLIQKRSRLLHLDVARRLVDIAPSVAKLTLEFEKETAHGTGFLIQPDLLLTNHHNVVAPEYGQLNSIVADFDDERGRSIDDRLIVKGRFNPEHGSATYDWAVIELDTPVERDLIPLGSPYGVNTDDTVIIIQHPLGHPKQFALDPKAVRYHDEDVIQYLADTQKGSSGSPVFSSNMHVVALHHGEWESTVLVEGENQIVWRNEGYCIKQVMNALKDAGIDFVAR